MGKRESGLSYSLSLQIFALSLTLRHSPTWHRKTRARRGPRTPLRARPSLLLPLNGITRIEQSVTSSVLRLEICPKKLPGVICAARQPEMGGWSQRALQQAGGGGGQRLWGVLLWALPEENKCFQEQKEAVWRIAGEGCEKLS